jgi:tRNA(Ile2) C34 agmatinyltransferase TiaS
MNTIEPDDRGRVRVCAQCGQRNRLIYGRLGSIFRCSKCRTEIPRPRLPFSNSCNNHLERELNKTAFLNLS